jgi:hypothetical protein
MPRSARSSSTSVRSPRDLRLIDLSAIPLRKLGIPRSGLIDTDASEYTVTRQWAIALHEQNQEAEGLIWTLGGQSKAAT